MANAQPQPLQTYQDGYSLFRGASALLIFCFDAAGEQSPQEERHARKIGCDTHPADNLVSVLWLLSQEWQRDERLPMIRRL